MAKLTLKVAKANMPPGWTIKYDSDYGEYKCGPAMGGDKKANFSSDIWDAVSTAHYEAHRSAHIHEWTDSSGKCHPDFISQANARGARASKAIRDKLDAEGYTP